MKYRVTRKRIAKGGEVFQAGDVIDLREEAAEPLMDRLEPVETEPDADESESESDSGESSPAEEVLLSEASDESESIDPSEYSLDELEDQIASVDDPKVLEQILESEVEQDDRVGAKDMISDRLLQVE